jgi:hypothetical protein
MQVIFRFDGYGEIEIWTNSGTVMMERRRNLPIVESFDHPHVGPRTESDGTLSFTKSQARSIASTLMQAAAEL